MQGFPHIVTLDELEEVSKPLPLMVKLSPPPVLPCVLDRLVTVRPNENELKLLE